MIKYYKLFDLLNRKGMKKTDLLDIISSPTLAKLSKGEIIKTDIIDKICMKLDCQPGDIMEYIPDKTLRELWTDENFELIWNRFEVYHGAIEKEDFKEIVEKCIDKKSVGTLKIDEDKLIRLTKEKADLSKLNL